MQKILCPVCGSETAPDVPCPSCGNNAAATNGIATPKRINPPPPPEAASWVIEPVPPEIAEHFRRTFNEAEYLAEVREVEKTGGVNVAELLAEVERIAHGKE